MTYGIFTEKISKDLFEYEKRTCIESVDLLKEGERYHLFLSDNAGIAHSQLKAIAVKIENLSIRFQFKTETDYLTFENSLIKSGYKSFWFAKKAI
jgi:hypothetical protein